MVLGILAHVDAGKTTMTEALLYKSGFLRQAGRVDSGNSFLDNDPQERERGITIISKQAELAFGDRHITLLDTPPKPKAYCRYSTIAYFLSAPQTVSKATHSRSGRFLNNTISPVSSLLIKWTSPAQIKTGSFH